MFERAAGLPAGLHEGFSVLRGVQIRTTDAALPHLNHDIIRAAQWRRNTVEAQVVDAVDLSQWNRCHKAGRYGAWNRVPLTLEPVASRVNHRSRDIARNTCNHSLLHDPVAQHHSGRNTQSMQNHKQAQIPDIKKARADNRAGFPSSRGLNRYDVLCLRAFLALRDSELNFLAFSQCLET